MFDVNKPPLLQNLEHILWLAIIDIACGRCKTIDGLTSAMELMEEAMQHNAETEAMSSWFSSVFLISVLVPQGRLTNVNTDQMKAAQLSIKPNPSLLQNNAVHIAINQAQNKSSLDQENRLNPLPTPLRFVSGGPGQVVQDNSTSCPQIPDLYHSPPSTAASPPRSSILPGPSPQGCDIGNQAGEDNQEDNNRGNRGSSSMPSSPMPLDVDHFPPPSVLSQHEGILREDGAICVGQDHQVPHCHHH